MTGGSPMELYEEPRPQVRAVAPVKKYDADEVMETVLTAGNLDDLTAKDRVRYYLAVCESTGLNPLTKPFDLLKLDGRTVLYATKNATDQLRTIWGVSVTAVDQKISDGLIVVTVTVRDAHGRVDQDMGVVALGKMEGQLKANALMKALTKAKRRATLAICGLGILDESEISSIPNAQIVPMDVATGEIRPEPASVATITDVASDPAADWERASARFHAAGRNVGLDHDLLKQFVADKYGKTVDEIGSTKGWSPAFFDRLAPLVDRDGAEWLRERSTSGAPALEATVTEVVETGMAGGVRRTLRAGEFVDRETGELVPAEDADQEVFPTTPASLLADEDLPPVRRNTDHLSH